MPTVVCDAFDCSEDVTKPPAEFERRDHHFCDQECYHSWKSDSGRVTITCDECGEQKRKQRSKVDPEQDHHFCDDECFYDWFQGENHHAYTGKFEIDCDNPECDESYDEWPSRISGPDDPGHNFCCPTCSQEFRRNRWLIVCSGCQIPFDRVPSKVNVDGANYCTRSCAGQRSMRSSVRFRCDGCQSLNTRARSRFEPYDLHFCNNRCEILYYAVGGTFDLGEYEPPDEEYDYPTRRYYVDTSA